ncbi:hypothetical protein MRX96_050979, partial [Rhipicephalus microplus]
ASVRTDCRVDGYALERPPLLREFQANSDSHPLPHPGLWRRGRALLAPTSFPWVPRHGGAISYSVSVVFEWMERLGSSQS